ncbi:FG-GAP repeat domain-containing protein [Cochlodiniinecator piscidefendens]|uniref:FG-GAP repeat domain-containing protein n=1 Tax=Cochlodiniinecator piscidefendens TaxID=2715756 RepID=UPI00140C37C1|nr:VCBS repeat-containing protein [Cochlodiniinecator piscidefendens]
MKRAVGIGLAALFVSARLASADIVSAHYAEPTERYRHGVFGDVSEFGALVLNTNSRQITIRLPQSHVFEDLEPRLIDVDSDGDFEVVVIETDVRRGAALAIYDETGKVAETPHIGRTNRWLAPIGAADLDGDGLVELAYIDRPHLAKVLRIWRFDDGALQRVADIDGLTNHRFGQDFISGGIAECGANPFMVTANAAWSSVVRTQFEQGRYVSTVIGPFEGAQSIEDALDCDN